MERIVVGMDGSENARDALAWAASLARAAGARLVAVNAHQPSQSEMRSGYLERLRDQRRTDLATWCDDLLDDVSATLEVVDGDPRDVIPAALDRHGADLLVVASSGESSRGPGFLRIGSVVEYLAHHLDRPLAVITPGAAPEITHIAIGVDGSEHGRTAISWTVHLAETTGAHVSSITVAEPKQALPSPEFTEDWKSAVRREVVSTWAAPFAALGDRFTAVVSEVPPVSDSLIRLAHDQYADLIVVGARGIGGVSGIRVGGTALGVLHRAKKPVVIVPADRRDR